MSNSAQRTPEVQNSLGSTKGWIVEEMRTGNLQFRQADIVENMQSGSLQYHVSNNFQDENPQYAENMQSGGLQFHNIPAHSNEKEVTTIQNTDIDLPVELPIGTATAPKRKVFGLSRRIFWLIIAVLVLIIIGAAVGGAAAGTRKNQSNTSAAEASTSSALLVVSTGTVFLVVSTTDVLSTAPGGSVLVIPSTVVVTLTGSLLPTVSTGLTSPTTPRNSNTPGPATSAPTPSPGVITVAPANPTTSPAPPATATVVSTPAVTTSVVKPAATSPADVPIPTRASSANTDGNYLVNCKNSAGVVSSGMAYYKNLTPGKNIGQKPDDYIDVTHGSYVTWEKAGVVTFGNGTPVHWSIVGNGQSLQANQFAGTADNIYENFLVYKDEGEQLYTADDWACYAMY